ncbi:MAG: hypothetical protein HC875_21400 [Anaerolineales bacterium]|nr:hypothetical protein [Anaerolineales bacterium]
MIAPTVLAVDFLPQRRLLTGAVFSSPPLQLLNLNVEFIEFGGQVG